MVSHKKTDLPPKIEYACMLFIRNRNKVGYTWKQAQKTAGCNYKASYDLDNPLVTKRLAELEFRMEGGEKNKYTEEMWSLDVRALAKHCEGTGDKRTAASCYDMLGHNIGALGKDKQPKIGKQQNILITSGHEAVEEMKRKVIQLESAVSSGTAIVDENE
jgi:hypothetical protein